jgi:hypothetical protein
MQTSIFTITTLLCASVIPGIAFGTTPSCPGDVDGDNIVDQTDLLLNFANWATTDPDTGITYGVETLLQTLNHWGNCNATRTTLSPFQYLMMERVTQAPSILEGHATVTYRLMAHLDSGGPRLCAMYAIEDYPISVQPANGMTFYQSTYGGPTSAQINPSLFELVPEVEWDSFLTIGLLDEVGDASVQIGFNWTTFESGGALTGDGGIIFATPDDPQTLASNTAPVCIGQFSVINGTGDGRSDLTGHVNLQGFDASGSYWTANTVSWSNSVLDVCPTGCTYSTIQSAIDAAGSGDIVTVASGTYSELLTISGKSVMIVGETDSTTGVPTTIVSGTGSGTVVTCENMGADMVFRHLEITGGSSTNGGGMSNTNASPTLINCTFTSNAASENGGAVYNASSSSPVLESCTLLDNTATSGHGGAVYSDASSNPQMNFCNITSNTPDGVFHATAAPGRRGFGSGISGLHECTICGNQGGENGQVVGAAIHTGDNYIHRDCDPSLGDLDMDDDVDVADLELLHSQLGICQSDVDHDGNTDVLDLLKVIDGWGICD